MALAASIPALLAAVLPPFPASAVLRSLLVRYQLHLHLEQAMLREFVLVAVQTKTDLSVLREAQIDDRAHSQHGSLCPGPYLPILSAAVSASW